MATGSQHVWDWDRLDPVAQRKQWEELAAWVAWLQEHYEAWVKLPLCWPRHEALRSELAFLKGWQEELLDNGDAYDGVSWHSRLRDAAEAWQLVADCQHEEKPWRRSGRGDPAAARQHLEIAMRGAASRAADAVRAPFGARTQTSAVPATDRPGRY